MSSPHDTYNIEHADTVTHSDQTDQAKGIDHATHVDNVQEMKVVNGTPPLTTTGRALKYVQNSLLGVVVLIALLISLLAISDKNRSQDRFIKESASNKALIQDLQAQLATASSTTSAQLVCSGRYQNAVESASANILTDIGDLVVILSTFAPTDPNRQAALDTNVTQLQTDTAISKKAVNDRIAYNNAGNPLPCPITEGTVLPNP